MKNNKNDLKCPLLDILLIVYLDEPQMVPNVQTREICGFLSSSSGFHLVACRYNFHWKRYKSVRKCEETFLNLRHSPALEII